MIRPDLVPQAAADLGLELICISTYRPELNPIGGLWIWVREEVNQH